MHVASFMHDWIGALAVEWPFLGMTDARVDAAGMPDRDELELQDQRREWINTISILS
jgi:hypothetical protein